MKPAHLIITVCLALITQVITQAGPVRQTRAVYSQPDGTSFNVRITGDEWLKVRTTEDGCAIVRDEDGWWCYGTYDEQGHISSTGYHIGEAPAGITTAARDIPYGLLSQKAADKRTVGRESALRTIAAIRQQTVRTRSGGETTMKRGLALLVEFQDVKFRYSRTDFYNMLNQKGYNSTGSAKDYYEYQFGEGWEFTFDVSEIITLNRLSEYYGRNDADDQDIRPWDMVAEACRAADSNIDFSLYDQDKDGFVDNVYVFYAGLSESENTDQPDLIWPHQYYIYTGEANINLICDGKRIDRYACSSEISGKRSLTGIGSFCHEYGHTFGLVDLYDTDYDDEGGWAAGTWGSTSLMDSGNYNNDSATPPNFNCIERETLGLSEAIILKEGESYTLEPIDQNGMFCRLDTDTPGEYYLFECRGNEGWDKYIGGEGMLVYHIDKNKTVRVGGYNYNAWEMNMVNAVQRHQCADLIEADGRGDAITSRDDLTESISGIFFPRRDVTSLGTDDAPALEYWNGNSSDLSISGIRYSGGKITFNVMSKGDLPDVPSVVNAGFTTFPDAAIITFEASDQGAADCEAVLEWKKTGADSDQSTTVRLPASKDGKYACKIDNLTSGNISYEVLIHFETGGAVSSTYRLAFMTKRKPTIDWPYIYIHDSRIKKSTGLPLHVVNASKAAEISWTYDDKDITPDKDLHFRPSQSGSLKAVVRWKDGSSDTIVKDLTVENP